MDVLLSGPGQRIAYRLHDEAPAATALAADLPLYRSPNAMWGLIVIVLPARKVRQSRHSVWWQRLLGRPDCQLAARWLQA